MMLDFVVDKVILRVELRFVSTTTGAEFVVAHGQIVMVMWFADSLDSLQMVTQISIV